jgi:transcriptional regulator with PAS, ATPase and Fis domain
LIQAADDGTLFLDEIAALPLDCQGRLLRLLEEKMYKPVGATTEICSDIRLVAATQFDLEAAVAQGQFRKTLFERLSTQVIDMPPLRAHLEDVPFLVQYFLDKLSLEGRRQLTVSDTAMHKLASYIWPGNLRQLRAELEVAALRSGRDVIEEGDVLVGCEKFLIRPAQKTAV